MVQSLSTVQPIEHPRSRIEGADGGRQSVRERQTRNDPAFSDSSRSIKRESSDRLLANIVYTATDPWMDLVGIHGSRYTLQTFATGKRPSVSQCSPVVEKEHASRIAVCMTQHCLQAYVTVLAAGHPGIHIVFSANPMQVKASPRDPPPT